MSSVVYTPRKPGKTEAEGRNDMLRALESSNNFMKYYVDDVDGNLDRGDETTKPTATLEPTNTKKPDVRKRNTTPPKSAAKSTVSSSPEESPSTRKSTRVPKRTTKAMDSDDADSQHASPKKKMRTKAITTFEAAPGKKVEPATIRKSTGRFVPINAGRPRARKIEKRSTDIINVSNAVSNAENTTKPQPAKSGVKRTADSDAVEADSKPKAKYAKRSHATTKVTAAEANNDMVSMNIENHPPLKGKGKGKAKKTAAPEVGLTTNRNGSSIEKPINATNTTSWKCANSNCNTGQTWNKRDGVGGEGRKVGSHFLGRNKKATRRIHAEVWHISCRKCYQRRTYAAREQDKKASKAADGQNVDAQDVDVDVAVEDADVGNGDAEDGESKEVIFHDGPNFCHMVSDYIDAQLSRIGLWRPQAKFEVQLTKSALKRLGVYLNALRKNGSNEDLAEKAARWTPKFKNDGKPVSVPLEYRFPIKKILEFADGPFCGPSFGLDHLNNTIMTWIRKQLDDGSIISMPPMEFLLHEQGDDEEITDPNTNYDRWTALLDGVAYVEEDAIDGEETDDDGAKPESAVTGPSGTQNTPFDAETEVVVEASAGEVVNEQPIDEDDVGDYESYDPGTPLEDRMQQFRTEAGEVAEDLSDDYQDEEGEYDAYGIKDGGYDYSGRANAIEAEGADHASDSESESEDDEAEPATPILRNSFGNNINQKVPRSTTIGMTATGVPGGKIKTLDELWAIYHQKEAEAAISPLTPTVPKSFEAEKQMAGENTKSTAGIEAVVEATA